MRRWKVPVGIDASQSEFAQPDMEGGEKAHSLIVGELASHSHIRNNHRHSLNGHTHSFNANTGVAGNGDAHNICSLISPVICGNVLLRGEFTKLLGL